MTGSIMTVTEQVFIIIIIMDNRNCKERTVPMTPENEAKKEYLQRYKWDLEALKEIEGEITACRLGALPGAITYSGMPHGSGNNTDLSDYMSKIEHLMSKFVEKREKAIIDLQEISAAIESVEDARSNILLRYRYIQCKEWHEIAKHMDYTEVYVRRELHSIALQNFKLPTKSYTDV